MSPHSDPGSFEKLNAPLLSHFAGLVTELGGAPGALLAAAQISDSDFADPTYRQAIVLLEAAARALECPDFGMRLATRQRGGSVFGPLGVVMSNSRTFGEALTFACAHSNAHSRAARVWQRGVSDEGDVFAGHELLLPGISHRAQAIEQILLIGHLEVMEMTGGYARARRVHFRHEPVAPRSLYRRYFGCEVRFGEPADGMVFSPADLACPILGPSSRVHRDMAAYVERNFPSERLPFHAEVRGLIVRRLGLGRSSSAEVARAMDLHVRTLRRRLAQEGSSFQAVKDEVRRDLTLYYLDQTMLDFRTISDRLGFAEQSVFSRSCRRWFGKSPREFRQG
ncbi:MAG: AraC family transcriptional regulator ligand-binding domain-containing protein [Novosphingobium sp.]